MHLKVKAILLAILDIEVCWLNGLYLTCHDTKEKENRAKATKRTWQKSSRRDGAQPFDVDTNQKLPRTKKLTLALSYFCPSLSLHNVFSHHNGAM